MVIVLYTDGFTEAENLAGEQYGLERLCQII
ncbi:MAG: SpoIIE family protein phosphatase [Gammaproteobacteria bacterium]